MEFKFQHSPTHVLSHSPYTPYPYPPSPVPITIFLAVSAATLLDISGRLLADKSVGNLRGSGWSGSIDICHCLLHDKHLPSQTVSLTAYIALQYLRFLARPRSIAMSRKYISTSNPHTHHRECCSARLPASMLTTCLQFHQSKRQHTAPSSMTSSDPPTSRPSPQSASARACKSVSTMISPPKRCGPNTHNPQRPLTFV